MMTTLREAAQQALEALEWYAECSVVAGKALDAADTLRAALAEHDKKIVWVEERKAHWAEQLQLARETQERERQQREEAALAEPAQEPVAWIHTDPDKPCVKFLEWREDEPGYRGRWIKTPLYTAPQHCPNCASLEAQNTELDRKLAELERKPLAEEEIERATREVWRNLPSDFDYTTSSWVEVGIRYAERAHGIGGNDA